MSLSEAGEIAQPLQRTMFLHVPIVSSGTATVTARLRAQGLVTSVANYKDNAVMAQIENVSSGSITVQWQEADSRNVNSGRSNVGSALGIVPKGRQTVVLYPTKQYLELKGVTGTGFVRVQLDSKIQWQIQAFNKDDTLYPPALWTQTVPNLDSLN